MTDIATLDDAIAAAEEALATLRFARREWHRERWEKIRARYIANAEPIRVIAIEFNTSQGAIQRIAAQQHWPKRDMSKSQSQRHRRAAELAVRA